MVTRDNMLCACMICRHNKLYHFMIAKSCLNAPLTRRCKIQFTTVKCYKLCLQIIQSRMRYPLIHLTGLCAFVCSLVMNKMEINENARGIRSTLELVTEDDNQKHEEKIKDLASNFLSSTGCHGCSKLTEGSRRKR